MLGLAVRETKGLGQLAYRGLATPKQMSPRRPHLDRSHLGCWMTPLLSSCWHDCLEYAGVVHH